MFITHSSRYLQACTAV